MLKDDRMMSMFTFLVIMLAIGTAIQRFDVLEQFFGGGGVALEYQRDELIVSANVLGDIDVLANDLGVEDGDAENLIIVTQPKCGRVFVRGGRAQYLPAARCVGSQAFRYAISGRNRGQTGEVAVLVRIGEPTQGEATANAQRDIPAPVPAAPSTSEPGIDEPPALLAAQSQSEVEAGDVIVRAPAVPRPESTPVAGLPDTASGAGSAAASGGDAVAAGVALDSTGQAPSLTLPSAGLTESSVLAELPKPPQPDRDSPDLASPGQPEATPSAGARTGAGASGTTAPGIQRELGGLDLNVPRNGPATIGSGDTGLAGFTAPTDALASVRGLGEPAVLAPVDTTPPAVLNDPNAVTRTGAPEPEPPAAAAAALPSPKVPCTVLPALTLDIRPAGITEVIIDSPCQAGTAVELSYETLRFGFALDAAGAGSIAAPGFQQATDATLRFADGQGLAFNIPFADTERMDRVALIWDMPVDLELNAFEFGARPGSPGHVNPKNPRAYRDVRQKGGGYLLGYRPANGVGQSVNVYTYWRRNGGKAGVVQLKLGVAGATGSTGARACGDGARARPEFSVLRSQAGRVERTRFLRLALDCATVAGMTDRYISDAVDDLIVRQR